MHLRTSLLATTGLDRTTTSGLKQSAFARVRHTHVASAEPGLKSQRGMLGRMFATATTIAAVWCPASALAQVAGSTTAVQPSTQAVADSSDDKVEPEIVIVGSRIEGSSVTAALPVTVITEAEIANTAAVSGDELFRSIPQMGDVSFNSSFLPGSSNSARGDVGSVNLRNLGVGNTLVLINGRRMVTHPTSRADENLVPVLTFNTNAIPVSGVARLEVLRDGAAAIYGSDAVAGVVNTVLRNDFDGASLEAQYGFAEGTGFRETNLNGIIGRNFGDGRGNLTLFANYDHREPLRASDQDFTASADRRPLFARTRFADSFSLDGRSTVTPFASLATPPRFGAVRRGGTALTSAGGLFHIQPQTNAGCLASLPGGVCIDDGALATATVDRNLRIDLPAAYDTFVIPKVDRLNLFATGKYELTANVELFGEAGFYLAKTQSLQAPSGTLASVPITIPASNFFNPFGPVTFADGRPNPNRLAGTNVPVVGLPVTIRSYRFADVGPTSVEVENTQYRGLAGIRFDAFGFDWEAVGLYSRARVEDRDDGISATLLQRQLALSTPDAYNPFNGGNLVNPSLADTTLSSQAALDAIRIETTRISTSTLALADFKVSRPDLFTLPGGSLGIAIGAEARRETQRDDRDSSVDGTTTFTDVVTGQLFPSDLVGTSASPDTFGKRTILSAFAELAVPLVSPEMNIPLIHNAEMQLAGRFESYSDIGSIFRPKVAAALDIVEGLRLRGSYSKGFKAPNLEQINATVVSRSNNRTDFVRCEARSRLPVGNPLRITSFTGCGETIATLAQRAGNPDLDPEKSTNFAAGIVLQPRFIPSRLGRVTLTADYWNIKQQGIVGIFGEGNALILDYLNRVGGTTNTNVVRAEPTADDIALFTAAGLTPAGQVLFVNDRYRNLLPQEAAGFDFGFKYQLNGTRLGSFSLNVNAAYLTKFLRDPSPDIQVLLDARAAGTINAGTNIAEGGSLIRRDGRPKWKATGSFNWTLNQFELGAFTQYTSSVLDTDLVDAQGSFFTIDDQITGNLYLQYTVGEKGAQNLRLRLGVRNITNEQPPLSSSGYQANLYNPYGRYWYANVRGSF